MTVFKMVADRSTQDTGPHWHGQEVEQIIQKVRGCEIRFPPGEDVKRRGNARDKAGGSVMISEIRSPLLSGCDTT